MDTIWIAVMVAITVVAMLTALGFWAIHKGKH